MMPVPNSPFKVAVTEGCQPSRVQAQGPGLKEAFTNKPNVFRIGYQVSKGLDSCVDSVKESSPRYFKCSQNVL